MAFVKRTLTESEFAALDLPALGVASYYLHFNDDNPEQQSSTLRQNWAVDEQRRVYLKSLFCVSDHRDGAYMHLLIVEGKPLMFRLWNWGAKQVDGQLCYPAQVMNAAALADFPSDYLEGLANEAMAVISDKGSGVIFEPAA